MTVPHFVLTVCIVATSLSHAMPKAKPFSHSICPLEGLLWNLGYLVVLQSQLSDELKKNYDFVDYLAFSHFEGGDNVLCCSLSSREEQNFPFFFWVV